MAAIKSFFDDTKKICMMVEMSSVTKAQLRSAIALSIKQPWAALLVCGCKSVEVRPWPTLRTGQILIHAAKAIDGRPLAWRLVPPEFEKIADLRGGIIGMCTLIGCTAYRSIEDFSLDQKRHLNPSSWFRPSLYGFAFSDPTPLPFERCTGWVRFFTVRRCTAGIEDDGWFPQFLENEVHEGRAECRA
jgi:ASCH domain